MKSRTVVILMSVLSILSLGAAAQTPVVVDAQGSVIGAYAGPARNTDSGVNADGRSALVVSSTGYTVALDLRDGTVQPQGGNAGGVENFGGPNYATTDCTGQAYVSAGAAFVGGFVLTYKGAPATIYYAPKGEVSVGRLIKSYGRPGACTLAPSNYSPGTIPLYPNDPATTGVSNSPYPGPLTLSMVASPTVLFGDGFESLPT